MVIRSIWAIGMSLVMGIASIAVGQEAEPPIEADINFTRGTFGAIHEDSFLPGEDIQVVVWITGLAARPEDEGVLHLQGKFTCRDSSGELTRESDVDLDRYEMLGPGVVRCSFALKVTGKIPHDEPVEVIFEAKHVETGRQVRASRKMYFRPVEGLQFLQYALHHTLSEPDRSAVRILQAGTSYHLSLDVEGLEAKAGEVSGKVTLFGCDVAGNPITAKTEEVGRTLPIAPNKVATLNVVCSGFVPNYAGEFLLRADIEDLHSGRKATQYIPISVVSGHAHPNVEPQEGELHVELQPTVGAAGLPRESDVYDEAETVFADLCITGLKGDAKGKGHVVLRQKLVDGDGEVIIDHEFEPTRYVQHLGGDITIAHTKTRIKRRKSIARTAYWTIELEDVDSGAKGSDTLAIRIEPQAGLGTKSLRLTLDKEGHIPAGSLLNLGESYFVHGEAVGVTIKDHRVDLEFELSGVDREGKPYSKNRLKFDETVQLSRYSERAPDEVPFVHELTLNRSGEHALRVLVRDKHSGEESYQDIPVSVVGYGPNDPPSKTR